MAKKKKDEELMDGLTSLLGEAPSTSTDTTQQRQEAAQASTEPTAEAAATHTTGDEQGAAVKDVEADGAEPTDPNDIINSVEDEELKAALRTKRMKGRGRPRSGQRVDSLQEGYTRACFIVPTYKMEKLREISFQATLTIKEVVEAAFDLAIEAYEAEHGEVIPNAAARKGNPKNLFKKQNQ